MALQRNNKVMKLPAVLQTPPFTLTTANSNGGGLHPKPYGGFQPVDIPERIISNTMNNNKPLTSTNGGEVSIIDHHLKTMILNINHNTVKILTLSLVYLNLPV